MAVPASRRRLPGALLATAIVLSGCAFVSQPAANDDSLGDGVRLELTADVSAENLMILSRGQGERGHLLGAVANRSDEEVEISIDPRGGTSFTITAPARSKVNLTHAGLVIETVEAAPGATQSTTLSSSTPGGFDVEVPVLDGTLPHYDRFLDGAEGSD